MILDTTFNITDFELYNFFFTNHTISNQKKNFTAKKDAGKDEVECRCITETKEHLS